MLHFETFHHNIKFHHTLYYPRTACFPMNFWIAISFSMRMHRIFCVVRHFSRWIATFRLKLSENQKKTILASMVVIGYCMSHGMWFIVPSYHHKRNRMCKCTLDLMNLRAYLLQYPNAKVKMKV